MGEEPRLRHRPKGPEDDAAAVDVTDPDENKEYKPPQKKKMNPRCKKFLASTPFKLIVFTIIAFVPVFGLSLVLPKLLEMRQCTGLSYVGHWLLSCWLASQFLYNFLATQWTDPGSSKKFKPPYECTGQYELDSSSTAVDGDESKDTEDDMKILFAPNWCEHCQHWKPPRSHHCSFCERCVLRMDHHCPFTGNCIGMRNHGHFILMYVFAMAGLLYCMFLCGSAMMIAMPGSVSGMVGGAGMHKKLPMFSPGIAGFLTYLAMQVLMVAGMEVGILVVAAFIALVAVLSFGCPAMLMASGGFTIIESQFPMKEYVEIKPQVYCPLGPGFYQRTRAENLRVILGPRWRLRLLCPTRAGDLDVQPGLRPRPGNSGLEALKARIKQVETEGVQNQVASCSELGFNPGPSTSVSTGDV